MSNSLRGCRIALVLHSFDRGGSGRVAGHLARGFAVRGATVELLVFKRGGATEDEVTTLAGPDISIRYLGLGSRRRSLDLIRGLPRLARALRYSRPDAVIAAANNVALVTTYAAALAGMPADRVVLKTTNPIASSRHKGLARLIRRSGYVLAFRRAAAVWTLSEDETREMAAAFPVHAALFRHVDNPYVTPAMLAPRGFAEAQRPHNRVIAVARLTKQKRLERLVAAFAQIRTPAELLILGEGEDRPALAAQIERLGLTGRVAMPGQVADVAPALHASDLLVLTSDYEGLPAAVLEAMAANCPVLATDCFPAARSLLAGSEGCDLIADHAPEPLAQQIDALLARSRPTQLREVAERFSIENGVASHARALTELFRAEKFS